MLHDAEALQLDLRLVGGVGVAVRCPSTRTAPLVRSYNDIDFVGRSSQSRRLIAFFCEHGYRSEERFNAVHGHRRLLFRHQEHSGPIDVLLDRFEMCHKIDLRRRLLLDVETLTLADLLVTKMQIVEINHKDLLDALALLVDHPIVTGSNEGIDSGYMAVLCAADWGLWRTLHLNQPKVTAAAELLDQAARAVTVDRIGELFTRLDDEAKPLAWRVRARVGDRVQWYEVPDEVS